MSEYGMVTTRLELEFEGLRAAVASFLVERQDHVQQMVNAQLEHLLSSGEIERQLQVQVERAVREQLNESVGSAVRRAFWDEGSKAALTALVVRGLAEEGDS